jgi:hypothetical protein
VNSSLPQLAGSCGIVSGLMVRLFAVVVARCEGGSLFFLVLIGATNLVRETRSFWSRFWTSYCEMLTGFIDYFLFILQRFQWPLEYFNIFFIIDLRVNFIVLVCVVSIDL